jgi:Uma2 family endonuclease
MQISIRSCYRATWDEYCTIGQPAEYIDGFVVPVGTEPEQHQLARVATACFLKQAKQPGWQVNMGWGWRTGSDLFLPDVMVYWPQASNAEWYIGTPFLCVEVLSQAPLVDCSVKAAKYAHAGVSQYWVIDPEAQTLSVLSLVGDQYEVSGSYQCGDVALMRSGKDDVPLNIASLFDGGGTRRAEG